MKNILEANGDLPVKELLRRAFNIKSVVFDANIGSLMFAAPCDLSDGLKITPPQGSEFATGLRQHSVHSFLHHASLTALSCPSLREILSALPDDVTDKICAVRWEHEEFNPNLQRHVFKIITYAGDLPPKTKNSPVIIDKKEYFLIPPFDPAVKEEFIFDTSCVVVNKQRKLRID